MRPDPELPETRTLVLSSRELDAAKLLLSQLVENPAPPPGVSASRSQLVGCAKAILHRRKKRCEAFPFAMFGEPAWDILLTLYTQDEQIDPTVTSLAAVISAPQSSTIRWLDYLEGQRFIVRESHPTDRRSAIARLTNDGRRALEGYLSEVLIKGL
jgi:DNA-binding MarR family transcriptional regulator